jgi:hypothetical protein
VYRAATTHETRLRELLHQLGSAGLRAWDQTLGGISACIFDRSAFPVGAEDALDLMGAAEPAKGEPFLWLRSVDAEALATARYCRDAVLGEASPPARCASLALQTEASQIPMEDIIAIEGERVPAAVAYRALDVIVLESEHAPLGLYWSCVTSFERARNLSGFQTSCDEVSPVTTLHCPNRCSVARTSARGPPLLSLALAALCDARRRMRPRAGHEPLSRWPLVLGARGLPV